VEAKSADGIVNPYTIALTRVDNLLLQKVVATPFAAPPQTVANSIVDPNNNASLSYILTVTK